MAIATIGATLEQKVWMNTTSKIHPNLFIFVVGHPGVGKTRTIRVARTLVQELPDFYLAPISMTWASLVDSLSDSKRRVVREGADVTYNSMFILPDEIGMFIHKYDHDMVDGLAGLYDPDPYSQRRRGGDLKIKIQSPQISICAGATPQMLSDLLPEKAWGQGFMSRVVMVFSDERTIGDDFAPHVKPQLLDLLADLNSINDLFGQFHVTPDYQESVKFWRNSGEPPVPDHPRLSHYNTRRRVNLYKLSMIAAIDQGNALVLTRDTFNTALDWLVEAERNMSDIFKAGMANADGQAMDEIMFYINTIDQGKGVSEQAIIKFAKDKVPIHSVDRVIGILEKSGQIRAIHRDRLTGYRRFVPVRGEKEGLFLGPKLTLVDISEDTNVIGGPKLPKA